MSKAPPTNTCEQTQATQAVTINSRKKIEKNQNHGTQKAVVNGASFGSLTDGLHAPLLMLNLI